MPAVTTAGVATMAGGAAMAAGAIVTGTPALGTAVIGALPCTQFAQPSALAGPNLTAAGENSQVALTWTLLPSATGYIVCEAAGPDYTKSVEIQTSQAANATVPDLTNGTTYYFWVVAAGKPAAVSNMASAIPRTVPGSPTGLTVTPGRSQATLSWTAPASDGGAAVTSYRVYDGTTATFQDVTAAATATGTSATVPNLANGTTYYFRVTAVNAAGEGLPSGEMPASLAPNTVPGPPIGLTATASGSQATLSWTAPASDGGATITGYVIDRGTSPDASPAPRSTARRSRASVTRGRG